jgi:precorrin-6B methylase 1
MALLLLQLGAHPEEIAATQRDSCLEGGAFFLDFSRPLQKLRWLGAWNRRIGVTMSLVVPVIHQAEAAGLRHIAVDRGDPYFAELQRLWRERFPAVRGAPVSVASATQIAADFAAQFPHDAAAATSGAAPGVPGQDRFTA